MVSRMPLLPDDFALDRERRTDGREVLYYHWTDRPPPQVRRRVVAPGDVSFDGERRWNAPLGEWVLYAAQRQDRTFLPPWEACPLCPSRPGQPLTELERTEFEIAVFENRFPSLVETAPPPRERGTGLSPVAPSSGACEVIVYTPEHGTSLGELPPDAVRRLISVWTHRTVELGARAGVEHVFPFENRGEAIGVTLHHPHGQVYAYPMVPPIIGRELAASRRRATGGDACMWCELLATEESDGRRLLVANEAWIGGVPFAARWPYEVHLTPRRHVETLPELRADERDGLAAALRGTLRRYDRLFGFPMPYVLAVHQAPMRGVDAPYHLHIELYPSHRTASRLKYLAGSELGAGVFLVDAYPEETAALLRAVDAS